MNLKRIALLIIPFIIMFAVTIGAGFYSKMVSSTEGHGAKGAYGYDVVILSALALVALTVIVAIVLNRHGAREKEPEA